MISIYSDKLAQTQVVINCLILLDQSAHKDILSQVAPGFIDDVVSYNSLTTECLAHGNLSSVFERSKRGWMPNVPVFEYQQARPFE